MDRLTATTTFPGGVLRLPQDGYGPRRRPPELDDPDWLKRQYQQSGDRTIAAQLGVNVKTVRAARARHGIPSYGDGPRRGTTTTQTRHLRVVPPARDDLPPVLQRLVARYAADQMHDIPPTWEEVIRRFKNANTARKEHDRLAEADAAISMAAALARVAAQLLDS
jgi:hypothetical protein